MYYLKNKWMVQVTPIFYFVTRKLYFGKNCLIMVLKIEVNYKVMKIFLNNPKFIELIIFLTWPPLYF